LRSRAQHGRQAANRFWATAAAAAPPLQKPVCAMTVSVPLSTAAQSNCPSAGCRGLEAGCKGVEAGAVWVCCAQHVGWGLSRTDADVCDLAAVCKELLQGFCFGRTPRQVAHLHNSGKALRSALLLQCYTACRRRSETSRTVLACTWAGGQSPLTHSDSVLRLHKQCRECSKVCSIALLSNLLSAGLLILEV